MDLLIQATKISSEQAAVKAITVDFGMRLETIRGRIFNKKKAASEDAAFFIQVRKRITSQPGQQQELV